MTVSAISRPREVLSRSSNVRNCLPTLGKAGSRQRTAIAVCGDFQCKPMEPQSAITVRCLAGRKFETIGSKMTAILLKL